MFFKKKESPSSSEGKTQGNMASFWGASDRMICCDGIEAENNEFNATSHPKLKDVGYVATLKISAPDQEQGIFIHAFYSGHRFFALSPSNEDIHELPNWHIVRERDTKNHHSDNGASVEVIEIIESDS